MGGVKRPKKAAPKRRPRKMTEQPSGPYKVPAGHVLVLRCCKADMTSHGGFRWPTLGPVKADDWLPKPVCGGGLHGWLWGAGDVTAAGAIDLHADAVWLVLQVPEADVIDLGGKVKFPRAMVLFSGSRDDAVAFVAAHAPAGTAGIYGTATAGKGGTATAGHGGTATAGDRGTATAGHRGTATAGDGGTATAGEGGTATAGYYGTATAGEGGTATAGYYGTATAGDRGTATAGHGGTATAGHGGTATAGDGGTATAGEGGTATAGHGGTATAGHGGTATAGHGGTATAGDRGTATAGHGGTATAGEGGYISILWWDGDASRCRIRSGDVGAAEPLKPGVKYRLNDKHEFEAVK